MPAWRVVSLISIENWRMRRASESVRPARNSIRSLGGVGRRSVFSRNENRAGRPACRLLNRHFIE